MPQNTRPYGRERIQDQYADPFQETCLQGVVFPYELGGGSMRVAQALVNRVPVLRLRCEAGVHLAARPACGDYAVICWVEGTGRFRQHDELTRVDGESVIVVDLRKRWSFNVDTPSELLVLRIASGDFDKHAERILDRRTQSALTFRPGVWRGDASRSLCDLASFSHRWFGGMKSTEFAGSDLLASQAEDLLAAAIIDSVPNNFSDELQSPSFAKSPWHVRLAREYVASHLQDDITTEKLARFIGVSATTLREAFRRCEGCSPTQYVRRKRLERVRNELAAGDGDTSVTLSAMTWGFCHLGRFSGLYADAFGEKPSETLRKARGTRRQTETLRHGPRWTQEQETIH